MLKDFFLITNDFYLEGINQKLQKKVVNDFRAGGYNVLIATSIGEEGLDIGSVDLIICFDALKSPIRLVQRMGRTGRARQGRIVLLMTEYVFIYFYFLV
jgi:ERCC4-related helicase